MPFSVPRVESSSAFEENQYKWVSVNVKQGAKAIDVIKTQPLLETDFDNGDNSLVFFLLLSYSDSYSDSCNFLTIDETQAYFTNLLQRYIELTSIYLLGHTSKHCVRLKVSSNLLRLRRARLSAVFLGGTIVAHK